MRTFRPVRPPPPTTPPHRDALPTPPGSAPVSLPQIPTISPLGSIERHRHTSSLDRPWPFGGDDSSIPSSMQTSPSDDRKGGLSRSSTMKSPLSILRRRWPGFSALTSDSQAQVPRDDVGRELTSRPNLEVHEARASPRQPGFRLVDCAQQARVLTPEDGDKEKEELSQERQSTEESEGRRRWRKHARPRSNGSVARLPSPAPSAISATAADILGSSSSDDESPNASIEIMLSPVGASPHTPPGVELNRPSIELSPNPQPKLDEKLDDVGPLPVRTHVPALLIPPKRTSSLEKAIPKRETSDAAQRETSDAPQRETSDDGCACSICARNKAADETSLRDHAALHPDDARPASQLSRTTLSTTPQTTPPQLTPQPSPPNTPPKSSPPFMTPKSSPPLMPPPRPSPRA